MVRKNTSNFISIAEVVYYDPKSGMDEAIRMNIDINLNESKHLNYGLPEWLEEHRDQIAKSIVKAAQNAKGESKFRFLKVTKIPFYNQGSNA